MLARGFHEAVAKMACSAARRVAERTGRDRVVLSGGCFVNRLLLDGLATSLLENGLAVYTHKRASAGDASLALGQAVAAAGRIEENANVTN
jgi:hydrogenase maturation protein HypF